MRDCSTITNSPKTFNSSFVDQCECNSGFYWSTTLLVCVRDCSSDTYSTKTYNTTFVDQCICNTGYIWSTNPLYPNKCILNCASTVIANAAGNSGINSCTCANGFNWTSSLMKCTRDCSTTTNSPKIYNTTFIDQCQCNIGFYWSTTLLVCVRDCSTTLIPYSTGTYNPLDVTQCLCVTSYKWVVTDLSGTIVNKCMFDCAKGGGISPYGYRWNPATQQCVKCNKN